MSVSDVVKAITVTAELTGASMSGAAIAVMAQDLLSSYSEEAITRALSRCRRELSRPLTAGAVFERLCENDGRPSSDEAWAMSLDAFDEEKTVVWTLEAREAFARSRPVLEAGDKIGARMAFKDAYERIVQESRENGFPAVWDASLGWDVEQRTVALTRALDAGRLPAPKVAALLPAPSGSVIGDALFSGKALPAPSEGAPDISKKIAELKETLQSFRSFNDLASERARIEREDLARRKREAAELVENHNKKFSPGEVA